MNVEGCAQRRETPTNRRLLLDAGVLQGGCAQAAAQAVLELIWELLGAWQHLDASQISIERVPTAMTNLVCIVRAPCAGSIVPLQQPHELLLRVYGESSCMFDRRAEEETALQLIAAGIVPAWHAIFGNGRFEQFLSCTPVSAPSFCTFPTVGRIAAGLATIHKFLPRQQQQQPPADQYWARLERWSSAARAALARLSSRASCSDRPILDKIASWRVFSPRKIALCKQTALHSASPLVFAHCDLHHGNVLQLQDSAASLLITDFEYAMVTARGLDFANFFCEFCSDYDTPHPDTLHFDNYPTHDVCLAVIAAYLGGGSPAAAAQIAREADAHLPLVHLQWGHWGIVRAAGPGRHSGFNYLRYAHQRYQQYHLLTKKYQ